jgi:GrpB-like predicted nucleotidyltransferase (UPF0157 family)
MHPEDARAYERLKGALAVKFRNDREAYNQAKTQFVEAILRRATTVEHSTPDGRIIP